MILTGLALFFAFLFFYDLVKNKKEIRNYDSFDYVYLMTMGGLALICAQPALKIMDFESMLSDHASEFADRSGVVVECTSVFDSIFDPYDMSRAGTAYIAEGRIVFHYGWCKNFMAYLDDPDDVSREELFGMHVFTHEVMHIRGERNERKTDCQAIQRNHLLGQQLGVDEFTACQNAIRYYKTGYQSHPYFSKECAPNKAFDEKLYRSIWDDL